MPNVTPYLAVDGAAAALEFYQKVFGAKERHRWVDEQGRIGHAEIVIGDSIVMLSDEAPELGVFGPHRFKGSSFSLVLEVDDADSTVASAEAAGATVDRPVTQESFGRSRWVRDPFGHRWNIISGNRR